MYRYITLTYNKILRFFGKQPKAYHQLGYYYYEQLFNRYRKKETYLQLLHQLEQQTSYITTEDIRLSDTFDCFEISPKEAIAKFGKPNFKAIQKKKNFSTDIMLYRLNLGKHKSKLELHFYNNKLAYYCYRLSYLNVSDINELQSVLGDKYLNSKVVNLENHYIKDQHNNVVHLYREGDLLVRYISTTSPLFQFLKNDLEEQEKEKVKFEKNHLITLKQRL